MQSPYYFLNDLLFPRPAVLVAVPGAGVQTEAAAQWEGVQAVRQQ